MGEKTTMKTNRSILLKSALAVSAVAMLTLAACSKPADKAAPESSAVTATRADWGALSDGT